jgi:molecular chaperone DnaK (HSP70)
MLFSAIKLAKLKPLALVSENTAAMVQYAFNRSFEKSFS